jgi:hypothetical protein
MKWRVVAAGAAVLGILAALAYCQLRPSDPGADASLAGNWEVAYVDRILGSVRGRATISKKEDGAVVRLVHPATGDRVTLRSTRFERDGARISMTLEGEWAGARGYVEQPLGEPLAIGAGTPSDPAARERLELDLAGAKAAVEVARHEPASRHSVDVELTVSDEVLTGTWSHTVNAETGRDLAGGGRIGDFAFADDGTGRAVQRGYEFWFRPRPVIHLVTPYADQLTINEIGTPTFPYPWKANGSPVHETANLRYLLVIGDDLPTEIGDEVTLASTDPKVTYAVEAKTSQAGDRPTAAARVQQAFAGIERQLHAGQLAEAGGAGVPAGAVARTMRELRAKDWVLLRAELARGAVPGPKGFTLNGAQASWVLRYGDFIADFAVVRPVGGETDPTGTVYAPEKIYLEFRTERELPFDEIPVQLWINDKPHLFDGSRAIVAKRLPPADRDLDDLEDRRRVAVLSGGKAEGVERVHVYRTPPIALVDAGQERAGGGLDVPDVTGDWRVPVAAGDVIRGVNLGHDLVRASPHHAEAVVAASPAETGFGGEIRLTWPRAVVDAARCAEVELSPPYDFNAVAQRPARIFSNFILLEGARRSPKVLFEGRTRKLVLSVGDHAAMLILRDTFIDMMRRQIANMEQISSETALRGFRELAALPSAYASNHPFASYTVPTPGGAEVSYSLSYASDQLLQGKFGLTPGNMDAWRLDAARALIRQYVADMRGALALAQDVRPCGDLDRLIQLTGAGFDGVQRQALERLVTTSSPAGARDDAWKADRAARAWVTGVPVFASALRSQQALSSQDTRLILAAAAVGTSGASLGAGAIGLFTGFEGLFIATVATVSDVVNLGSSVYGEVSGKLAAQSEIRFARGASAAVGTGRLEDAIASEKHWAAILPGLYLEATSTTLFFDMPTFLRGLSDTGRTVYSGGRRLVSQTQSIVRGRLLLGQPVPGTSVIAATPELVALGPPKIAPADFARDFPDGKDIDRGAALGIEQLRDPANPGQLLDDPGDYRGPVNIRGDTNLESLNIPRPEPGLPAGGPSIAEAEAAAANTKRLGELRQRADEAYEEAQRATEEALAEGRELTETQTTSLVNKARTAAMQETVEEAVAEARAAGVTEAELNAVLGKYDTEGIRPDLTRRFLVNDLQRLSIERLGYELVDEIAVQDAMELATRALTRALRPKEDAELLKRLIDASAAEGRDFFDRLARQGTFTELDGFEALVEPDSITALRRFAEENRLLPEDLLDTRALNRQRQAAQADTLDKVRALPEPQRVDVFNAIIDSRRVAAQLGPAALEPSEALAFRLSEQLVGDALDGVPEWARGLGRQTYERIAHMAGRGDIQSLAKADPSRFKAIADTPDGLATLERQPWLSAGELEQGYALELKRQRQPVQGVMAEAAERAWLPKNLDVGDVARPAAFEERIYPEAGELRSESWFRVDRQVVARFDRSLRTMDDGGLEMIWNYAEGKMLPRFFKDVKTPLTPRGTPAATMMNLRAFSNLNVAFGDPRLKVVRMAEVMNANTGVQIEWLKRVYGADWEKYLRHTHSVRYAESALNQAGFRVRAVRIGYDNVHRARADVQVEGDLFHAVEKPADFLRRYGIKPETPIESGHDIFIDVEPIRGNPASSARPGIGAPLEREAA